MRNKFVKIAALSAALMLAVSFGAFAQFDLLNMQQDFETFSEDVAQGIPFASTTGLNWSDAKVRGFPHFGVGLSFETAMLPSAAFEDLADSLNIELPSDIIGGLGIPMPGYTLDARLGIPVLPIDVGAKFGVITSGMAEALEGVSRVQADYTLIGFDVRYPIIEGGVLLPAISTSAGYNYLKGGISMEASGMGSSISTPVPGVATIDYSDPLIRFAWQSSNLDFKMQASKGLLIFTPHVGLGYTYGWSKAGGGISAEITNPQSEIDLIQDYYDDIEIDDQGFVFLSKATGGAFRAFGGMQVNLTIFKLDLNAKYNFSTGNLGAGINARIQI
jgi:hypothetical protein